MKTPNISSYFSYSQKNMLMKNIMSTDCHPMVQFAKFAVCGVISTAVHMFVFYSFATSSMLPALDSSVVNGELITDSLRARNSLIINMYAFIIANIVGYILNILMVFKPGRHNQMIELGLFLVVSFVGFSMGLLGGPLLIHLFSLNTHIAQALLVITTTLVNYFFRKHFVFKK